MYHDYTKLLEKFNESHIVLSIVKYVLLEVVKK